MEKFNEVEILLVEDNPYDAELTLRALKNKGLANKLLSFADGVEALDFLFGTGEYAGRNLAVRPKVILLDLKLPGSMAWKYWRKLELMRGLRRFRW